MPDAPIAEMAMALCIRGVTYRQIRKFEEALNDCTAVINMPDVFAKRKAEAFYLRGTLHIETGNFKKGVGDVVSAIELHNAPTTDRIAAVHYHRVIEIPDEPATK